MRQMLMKAAALALPFMVMASPCIRKYTVLANDYCEMISAANNVSNYQLSVLNPTIDSDCTNLEAGQVLCLGTAGQDCSETYVVKANEDCQIVADTVNVPIATLVANNPNVGTAANCTIYEAEVLCTSTQIYKPTKPT